MLLLMSLTYSDIFGHLECLVNFWQLFCLDVFRPVFDFRLFQKIDQRICIKFCIKNNLKCADAFRMLTVEYGEATLDKSKMFSDGREDVSDEEHSGRPSTSTTDENIDEVKKLVLANRRITVREVAEDLNISIASTISKEELKINSDNNSIPTNPVNYDMSNFAELELLSLKKELVLEEAKEKKREHEMRMEILAIQRQILLQEAEDKRREHEVRMKMLVQNDIQVIKQEGM